MMIRIRVLALTMAALSAVGAVSAAPAVTGVSGTFGNRRNVTISGTGFGSKNPAAPLLFADFDGGLNPATAGIKRAWDQIQAMQWSSSEGVGGTGCAKAADGIGIWSLRVDYDYWTTDGRQMYIFKKEKMNFRVTSTDQNWKSWRVWPNGNGYPNIYASQSHGRIFVEEIGGDGGYWADIAVPHTNWSTQEFIFRASTMNRKDGRLTIRYDGSTVADGDIMTRSSAAPAYMSWNYPVHGVAANQSSWSPSWSSSNRLWADDVYVDTTWSRVMIGEASTYSNCRRLEVQLPTAWSAGAIGITVRTGTFAQGSTVYLYVFDNNGNVNPIGFPVVVGSAGSGGPVIPTGPTASAGPDAVAALGTPISMRGSFTAGTASSATSRWTVITGPGRVDFVNPGDPNTMATFDTVGDYLLQFTVSAGQDEVTDQVRVSVIPSTVGQGGIPARNVFNPARGETFRIVHVLDQPGRLEADIMDRSGHLVRSLDGGDRPAGEQVIEWDGRNDEGSVVASGIYLVVREANGRRATSKVAVVK